MSDNWSFEDLDLSDVQADSGEMRLKPGRYVCKITHASLEKVSSNANGRRVQLAFTDVAGRGSIKESINIKLPGKKEAEDIGKKAFKTLLTHAGHPTPDHPSDVKSIIGLTVGVNVEPDSFENDKGDTIPTSRVHAWHPYFNPENAVNLGPTSTEPKSNGATPPPSQQVVSQQDFDDDIPF